MKQILHELQSGKYFLCDAPDPLVKKKHLITATCKSLISNGTERMLLEFGKGSWLHKVKSQPDKVKQVLEKVQNDGLLATYSSVQSKLSQPIPMGYCNVGVVKELGPETSGFQIGDRVVSNGPHANVALVPANLCAKIPENVSDEHASFTVLASIGMQAVRLAKPEIGERFVVMGVGIIGLLIVQILRANGCEVLAMDFSAEKLKLAEGYGAATCNLSSELGSLEAASVFSEKIGVDGVIISASTESNDPITQAAQMSRKRGRIILVGVTGLDINRADFYEKELTFQVSCSYGPGRYDSSYENDGIDYPIGFVRWTVQRNFDSVLTLMKNGSLKVDQLITKSFIFSEFEAAYELLLSDPSVLGILLDYSPEKYAKEKNVQIKSPVLSAPKKPVIGFIGAGGYASKVLFPICKKSGARLYIIASRGGLNASIQANRWGFEQATSDSETVFLSDQVNTVFIATHHDTHAHFVIKALQNGKNVFVEKPLCVSLEELEAIRIAWDQAITPTGDKPLLMVGFNRRFSTHVRKMKKLLLGVDSPKAIILTINAGTIDLTHWTQDKNIGGGRIIGEGCHFIDLMRHIIDYPISSIGREVLCENKTGKKIDDVTTITATFSDGSIGTIHYFANGSQKFPKERIEVFAAGKILELNNFRNLTGYGFKSFKKKKTFSQDKGQVDCVNAFLNAVESGETSPIDVNDIFEVAEKTIEVARQG